MEVKERSSSPWTSEHPAEPLVFRAEGIPGILEARKPAAVDRYDVDLISSVVGATTVLFSLHGTGGLVLPLGRPVWQRWLPEVRARISQRAESGGAASQQISEIQQITGLTDQQVAAAFPGGVSRETVNRWRNRPDSNLRPENLYRLGVLHQLAKRMQDVGVDAPVWLFQPVGQSGDTPYDLICRGQLAAVRQGVERIAAGENLVDEPMTLVDLPREWDVVANDDDDDGEWIGAGPGETAK